MVVEPRYTLELFMEQGSEGARWSVYDNTKKGYDGLIDLSDDDYIQIYSLGEDRHLVWEGVIQQDRDSHRRYYYRIEKALESGQEARSILSNYGYNTCEMSNKECEYTLWRSFSQPIAGGYACHWTQKGVDPDEWASWFRDELEVVFL